MFCFLLFPTLSCNARCKHCAVGEHKKERKVLSYQDLFLAVKNVLKDFCGGQNTNIKFIFHGGEPMLLGFQYYDNFLQLVEKEGWNYTFSIQTNLLLYDKKWRNFLRKYQNKTLGISTSYDFFLDFRRLDTSENGSEKYYKLWLKKLKQFQDDFGDSLKISVISMLTKQNYHLSDEIIDIANELGVGIKLNALYDAGDAVVNCNGLYLTPEEYGTALVKAYRRWKKKGYSIDFFPGKEFEAPKRKCPYYSYCSGHIFGIAPDGKVYNCGIAIEYGKYCFGDALKRSYNFHEYYKACFDEVVTNEECLNCDVAVCNGGCKLFRTEDGKSIWCEAYKMLDAEVKKWNIK